MSPARPLRALVGAVLLAAAAAPALAQTTAVEIIRSGMRERGIYSGVEYDSRTEGGFDPITRTRFNDLEVSKGIGIGGGQWTFIVIIRNTTSQVYCIRPQITAQHNGTESFRLQGNQLVQPGGYLPILVASGPTNGSNINAIVPFAYWRPDMSKPEGSVCRSVAPAGVDQWAASGDLNEFNGSRR